MDIEQLKYPVGVYEAPAEIDKSTIEEWIKVIEELPNNLRGLVENLSYDSLDWSYRPGGWTIKQVVHHIADSHMNSFIRFKLSLTEDNPTIRPYLEGKWAELPDANNSEIGSSLEILEGLHARMVTLFTEMKPEEWSRTFYHPEHRKELTLSWMLGNYAWHSSHHLSHISQAIENEGDFEVEIKGS